MFYEAVLFALLALYLYFLLCPLPQTGKRLLLPAGVIVLAGLLELLRWIGGFSAATFFA